MTVDQLTLPICEISTYHSKWTIKARVTAKSPIREFNNGNGKVFHVDLLDRNGGEIRASFFNQGADKHGEVLQVGKCYILSKGSVKVANRQFNTCNHRYELTFDKEALVAPCADDVEIKTMQFSFTDLRVLQNKTLPAKVDLCGVVVSFKPSYSFKSSAGKDLVKREITLVDDTATSIDVTLWGDRATEPDAKFDGKVLLAFKGILVKEWNGGRSGSLLQDGVMEFNPCGPESERINKWWLNGGSSSSISTMSVSGAPGGPGRDVKEVSLADIRAIADSVPGNAAVYKVMARLSLVQTSKQGQRQPLSYLACTAPREGTQLLCNKRVNEDGKCPVCGSVGKAVARLNTRCKFIDYTDTAWMTTFHEGAESLLDMTGEAMRALEQVNADGSEVDDALRQRYCLGVPHQLTIRAKRDEYQGEVRCSISCVGARPVQLAEHGKHMLAEIHQMLGAAAV